MGTAARPVAFVTGASRGIGKACALHLAAAGFDLALTARSVRGPPRSSPSTAAHQLRRCRCKVLRPAPYVDAAMRAGFEGWLAGGALDLG